MSQVCNEKQLHMRDIWMSWCSPAEPHPGQFISWLLWLLLEHQRIVQTISWGNVPYGHMSLKTTCESMVPIYCVCVSVCARGGVNYSRNWPKKSGLECQLQKHTFHMTTGWLARPMHFLHISAAIKRSPAVARAPCDHVTCSEKGKKKEEGWTTGSQLMNWLLLV